MPSKLRSIFVLFLFISLIFFPVESIESAPAKIENFGSKYVFNAGWSIQAATAPLSSSKYVIAFSDADHSYRGVAVVATVSGRSITYGPQTIFDADSSQNMSVAAINSTHFSIAYTDGGNSDRGTIITGTIGGGDAITFTSSQAFSTGTSANFSISLLNYDVGSDTGWLVAAFDEGGSGGNGTTSIISVVGNGATTTIGAPVTFNAARIYWADVAALSSSSFLVVFTDHGNSDYGTAMAATVAGYVPTFGAEFEYNASFTSSNKMAALSSTKAVVVYDADGAPMHGRSRILSVSGTVVSAGAVANIVDTAATGIDDVIALSSDSFMVAYSYYMAYMLVREGNVSGTDITYDTFHFYSTPLTGMSSLTYLSPTKFAISFCDAENSNYGTSMIADVPIFVHPIGTLVQVKSPYSPDEINVYRVVNTYEVKWIPNIYVFNSQFSWNKIVPVGYSERVDYDNYGEYYPYRDCELVKEPRANTVYVFENGLKRQISNPTVFLQYGFSWANIISVPDFSLDDYTTGAALNAYSPTTYPNGCLLKANNSNNIYMIDSGDKRLIPNPTVYLTRFLSWSKFIAVDPSVLSDVNYPVGSVLPYRDGELVKEQSTLTVYAFENELKRRIVDPAAFLTYDYSWANIITAPDGSLASYGDGADISI